MSDLGSDFVKVQVGGERHANVSPPPALTPALTPTHLWTAIKATNRDGGLIFKVRLCRTEQTNQATSGPSVDDNPFIPSPEIQCMSELFQSTQGVVSVNHFLMPPGHSPAASGMIDFPYSTASISQCFMTKHCKKEERDSLLFIILFNKKDKYHTSSFLSFFLSRHDLRSFIMLGL